MPEPIRTCLGCGAKVAQRELVRLVAMGARVRIDGERQGGRGAWLHASDRCLDRAVRKRGAFARAFRRSEMQCDAAELRLGLTEIARRD